jgi:phosphate:Na+ symporter
MGGAAAWAGLGLFFIGMRQIGSHLQQLSGGPLRRIIASTLSKPLVPALAGFISGALVQSTSAVTFIAAGLVGGRTITVRGALPLLAWANVGTSVLVLLAAVDVRLMVYYLLGLIGLAFFGGAEQSNRFRHLVLAALGLALLLLGLSLLKDSVRELQHNPWINEFLVFADSGEVVAMLVGFVIATAVQSSSIVTVLALPLAQEGLLDLGQVALMIYGASVGSGFAVLLLAQGLEGALRQLALCQAGLRGLAAAVMLPLLLIEQSTGLPLVLAAARSLAEGVAMQCGLIYLAFQLAVYGVTVIGGRWLATTVATLSPEQTHVSQARPAYLFDEAVNDPETALSLATLEYHRLVSVLPEFVEDLRPAEERAPGHLPLEERITASSAVERQLTEFLGETQRINPDMAGLERLFRLRSQVLALQSIHESLAEFARQLSGVPEAERPPLARHMVEGLHLLLGVAGESVGESGDDAADMLRTLTEERGELMDRVRKELLGGSQGLAGRQALLSATLLFERLLWLLRRL